MKEGFLKAIGKMVYGIYVLTASYKDEINAMIASWVSQVSYDPLLIMAAVHPNRYSNFLIEKSGFFAIHIISQNQKDLLGRFKGPDPKEKFSSLKWHSGKTNCPILEDCIACLECKVIANYRPGNHILYVGEVMDAKVFADAKPLSILDYEGIYKGDK